jgi:hypothetical protein
MNYKVIANFLPVKEFKILQDYLFNSEIGWFFRDSQTRDSKNKDYYFTHSFYNNFRINSEVFIPLIVPILNKLNAVMIDEVRANLFVNRFKQIKSEAHIDKPYKNCTTAILYMNTNNGYTNLNINNKDIKILSEENKILIFNNEIKHSAVSQTNTARRIIINFNYLTKEDI